MSLVIATGCPVSGWEIVLPVLAQMDLKPASEDVVRWLGRVSGNGFLSDLPLAARTIEPSPAEIDSLYELLQKDATSPLMLADSKNLRLLDFWAKVFPETKFLLFYVRAELALSQAVMRDQDLQHAFDTWQAANRAILGFQRRYRARSLLFEAQAVVREPQGLIPVLQRNGFDLRNPEMVPLEVSQQPALERLLAAYWLEDQPAVQHLEAELEASAYPLSESPILQKLHVPDLLRDYRRRQLEAKNNEEQLRAQIQQMQQDLLNKQSQLEKWDLDYRKSQLEAKNNEEQLRAQIQQMQQDLLNKQKQLEERDHRLAAVKENSSQSFKAEFEDLKQENELLLSQLHQVQEELETIFLQKQSLEQQRMNDNQLRMQMNQLQFQLSSKERELEERNRTLAAIKESTSWKFSAPVRFVAKKIKRGDGASIKAQIAMVKASGLFDEAWYLAQYPDVRKKKVDPVEHYLRFGAAEGRNPSPAFKTQDYLNINRDVAESGMNPLIHYIQFGREEGRATNW